LLEESHCIQTMKKTINVGGETFKIPNAFYQYLLNNTFFSKDIPFIDRDPIAFLHVLFEIYPHFECSSEAISKEQLQDELTFYKCQSNNWFSPLEINDFSAFIGCIVAFYTSSVWDIGRIISFNVKSSVFSILLLNGKKTTHKWDKINSNKWKFSVGSFLCWTTESFDIQNMKLNGFLKERTFPQKAYKKTTSKIGRPKGSTNKPKPDFTLAIHYFTHIWSDDFLQDIVNSTNNFANLHVEAKILRRKNSKQKLLEDIIKWTT